ncbi:MAG TPA: cyclic nucleotide-binding domain-containing protein [Roseomonas sp.]
MQDGFSLAALAASPILPMGLVALASLFVTRVLLRRQAALKLVALIGFFLALTLMLHTGGILPYEPDTERASVAEALIAGFVKAIWWLHIAWMIIAGIRLLPVQEGRPREGRLLQDVVIGLVWLGTLLSIIAYVFGVPVGALVATSGVFAVILGLALQSTLNDAFSGIALNLGRSYALGDWIVLSDGTEGRVVESNWRATHLLSGSHNLVVLPNSVLAKLGLTNISHPDSSHGISLSIRLAPTRMPSIIVEAMQTALLSCNTILKDPPPSVAIKALDAEALEVELQVRVESIARRTAARNEIFDLVYRHAKSHGLMLARPASASGASPPPTEETAKPPRVTPLVLLEAIPLFAALQDEERQLLAETATVRRFRKGEVVVRQGEMLSSLMIMRKGVLVMTRDAGHGEAEIGRLAPGDCFGETGLLAGMGEAGSLRALTPVIVYEIDQASFAPLLQDRPGMAEELALSLSRRVAASQGAAAGHGDKAHDFGVSTMLKAIRDIFRTHDAH